MALPPIKVIIAERNGVELAYNEEYNLESDAVPFAPGTSGLVSTEAGPAIRELASNSVISASPGFTWGRSGNCPTNTFLLNDTVPSNTSGRLVFLYSAAIIKIFVSSRNADTYALGIYTHDGNGVNLTLISTSNIVAAKSAEFTLSVAVARMKQLAVRVTSGSPSDVVAGIIITGRYTP